MSKTLRHHSLNYIGSAQIEVWDDDGDDHLSLVIDGRGAREQDAYVNMYPNEARALAALLNMAAENCEKRNAK